jgi:hypothetical protein
VTPAQLAQSALERRRFEPAFDGGAGQGPKRLRSIRRQRDQAALLGG